jgi:hypothetical protein
MCYWSKCRSTGTNYDARVASQHIKERAVAALWTEISSQCDSNAPPQR